MSFDPQTYGDTVAAILHIEEGGQRLMPLVSTRSGIDPARKMIRQAGARQLFPQARAPEAAMAGLYLYFDCWAEAQHRCVGREHSGGEERVDPKIAGRFGWRRGLFHGRAQ